MSHLGRCNSLGHGGSTLTLDIISATLRLLLGPLDVQIVVTLVSPEVLGAGQALPEEAQDSEYGIGRDVFVNLAEHLQIYSLLALEAHVKYLADFVESLDALLEVVKAASFLSEHALVVALVGLEVNDGQRAHDDANIIFGDEAIVVEVVNFKHERRFLIKVGAKNAQQAREELTLVQIVIVVGVHDGEESFT